MLSPWTTPPINCSPVSTTPPINFSSTIYCIDNKALFFLQIGTNRWYLRTTKLDTAADGVIGTAMKSCTLHILMRPLRPLKLLQSNLVLVTGNKFIASVVFNGDNCLQVSLTPVRNLLPVSTTPAITENLWQGLLAGVINLSLAINLSPVSLTPVNRLLPVSLTLVINIHSQISLRIFEKIRMARLEDLLARRTMINEKNLKSKISCQSPLNPESKKNI